MTRQCIAFYTAVMDTREIVQLMGGQSAVRKITGLSRGRISQWVIGNNIPRPWAMFLSAKFSELDFSKYIEKLSA